MKILLPFLLFWTVFSGIVSGQNSRSSQDPEYVKYEYEDVRPFRQQFSFTLPQIENEVVPVEVPGYQSLEKRYFAQGGKVHIEADPRLAQFINLHKQINSRINTVSGYRIQIFAGTSRDFADRAKSRFLSQYPGIPSYLMHIAPNYRVRVGDYLEKNEAQKVCNQLKDAFPGAFVVPDEVSVPRYKSGGLTDD